MATVNLTAVGGGQVGAKGGAAIAKAAATKLGLGFGTGLLGGLVLGVGLSSIVAFGVARLGSPAPQAVTRASGAIVTPQSAEATATVASAPAVAETSAPELKLAPSPVKQAAPAGASASARGSFESEVALLARARAELASDPARSLASTDEHRERFGSGVLEQEREVIAIDALLRLRRRQDAEARAARFEQNFAGSAHARRVTALLAAAPR